MIGDPTPCLFVVFSLFFRIVSIEFVHRRVGAGDALRIPTIMGDTQHSASDAAAADADGFTNIPPALKPELLADPLPSASGGRSRIAWGQEGAAEVFDAGVSQS